MRHLTGLATLAENYQGFIIDLWGVIHDGVRPYAAAMEVLAHLQGRPVLLLSNAPRRAASAQAMLRRMGVPDTSYSHILTSGEVTWLALRDRTDPWFARLGSRVYHLGPERDRSLVEDLGLRLADTPPEADFLLNTGPDDERGRGPLEDFFPELEACRRAGLPMICANPDLVVMREGVRILCAGALAAHYASLGGDVRSMGKPDPAIYAQALSMLGLGPSEVLAIGDSLHTDVAGAAGAGIDAVWILGGIHDEETRGDHVPALELAARFRLQPLCAMHRLAW
jgi:HAD superfamily hydrolase (TIGR01459 family)